MLINYMKFDVMWIDKVIARVHLKPANGGTPYVINYITDFNKQFSPNLEGHITVERIGEMAEVAHLPTNTCQCR